METQNKTTEYVLIQGEYRGKVTIAKSPQGVTQDITLKEYEQLKARGLIE
jgi:hypothetical protein